MRMLAMPKASEPWSLTSLREKHDEGCGQMRRPTVQDPSRQTRKSKFRHHKAATDRFGRPAEHRCGNSNGRSRVQIANLANIAVYVVTRIVLVPLSGQASGEFRLNETDIG